MFLIMPETLSPIKRGLILTSLCLLGIITAFVMAEFYLRYRADRIQKSNNLEIGMVKYDRLLGWKLMPGWQGNHKHFDFQVTHTINAYGFRFDFNTIRSGCENLYAVVGDSFTFGMGVENGQTFVGLLNKDSG